LVMLLAPFAPHVCEEMWEMMGGKDSVVKVSWPAFNEAALKLDSVTMVVQINGKIRSKYNVEADAAETKLRELVNADDKLKIYLEGKEIRKFIVVPNKLISIVV